MTVVRQRSCGGIPVLSLTGVVGGERAPDVDHAVSQLLRGANQRVLLDLRATLHLHYRVAGSLARMARNKARLGLVGPTPYVRQILRLAGILKPGVSEYDDLEEALRDAAA